MTRPLTVVSLLPELLDTNGDASNARVLAQRARWAGHGASVVPVTAGEALPAAVDAVVLGSGVDADFEAARGALLPLAETLREWVSAGVPVLAVGTGWELLSWGVELADGHVIEGLGVIPGRAVRSPARLTGDLVVSSRFGRLIGFENHARYYVGAEGSPLGRTVSGTGNGSGTEGVIVGSVIGTHMHGPVLARNPALGDHILTVALGRDGRSYARGGRSAEVDEIAKAARNQIAVRLGLATE
jgi:hypothetical protein